MAPGSSCGVQEGVCPTATKTRASLPLLEPSAWAITQSRHHEPRQTRISARPPYHSTHRFTRSATVHPPKLLLKLQVVPTTGLVQPRIVWRLPLRQALSLARRATLILNTLNCGVERIMPTTDAALVQSHHRPFSCHFPLLLVAQPLLPVHCKQDYQTTLLIR